MLKRFISHQLNRFEKSIGVSVDWARHVLRHSLRLFFKFMKFGSFAKSRRALPLPAWHVAVIVGARSADCGPCVQIAATLARKEGVAVEILKAVIDQRPDALPLDLREVYLFSESVMAHSDECEALRESLRARYGEEGLIELAFALASGPVIPTIKRALGHATSCSKVTIKV